MAAVKRAFQEVICSDMSVTAKSIWGKCCATNSMSSKMYPQRKRVMKSSAISVKIYQKPKTRKHALALHMLIWM